MLEAVPNVSEGRDSHTIAAVADAFVAGGATLLDVHTDADHNRSVLTLVADEGAIVEALLAGVSTAVERIDLSAHTGVHPRVGVVDVVPLVPLAAAGMPEARAAAAMLARRIGAELGLPVFGYGELGGGRRPAFFRRGGLDELVRRVAAGELAPDAGPSRIDPRSGAVLVGARAQLVAYNLVLATDDVTIAGDIAATIRESSGGLAGVQAIGILLASRGLAQVSTNLVDVDATPLHEVVERVRHEAKRRGTQVLEGELVGLVPERVVEAARHAGLDLPGVDPSRILERVLRSRLAG